MTRQFNPENALSHVIFCVLLLAAMACQTKHQSARLGPTATAPTAARHPKSSADKIMSGTLSSKQRQQRNKSAGPQQPAQTEEQSSVSAGSVLAGSVLAGSVSVGSPNQGSLMHAAALPTKGNGWLHNPQTPNPTAHYATEEFIGSLTSAAVAVAQKFADSTLYINDLALQEGGKIPHHGSHQNGRDADILFYLLDESGRPRQPLGVSIGPDGVGWQFGKLEDPSDDVRVMFDSKRTLAFLLALSEQKRISIQRIFIAEHLRTLLLQEAIRQRIPRNRTALFEKVTCQPSTPHDHHMHVRIYCDAVDIKKGCLDVPPIYPWHREQLNQLGVKPVVAAYRSKPKSKPTPKPFKEPEQPTAVEQEVHIRVQRFEKARRAWIKQPHPGRRWCR